MFWLTILCLCFVIFGRGEAIGEAIQISVVNGSVSELANYEVGDSISLRCEASGLAMSTGLVVAWLHGADVVSRDGALTESYTGSRFAVEVSSLPGRGDTSLDVAHQLNISPLGPTDGGNYTCVLSGPDPADPMSYVTVIARSVTLAVSYFPDQTNPMCTPDGPIDVFEGDAILLRCSTQKGSPQVRLTLTGAPNVGPWSIIQDSDTISQERLLDGVSVSSSGSSFVCNIESSRFPGVTRSCTLGPVNVVRRPVSAIPGPGDPMGPRPPTAVTPTNAPDPACRGWLIAFVVSAAVATLSIIVNVMFLAARQMKKDRMMEKTKKTKKTNNDTVLLNDITSNRDNAATDESAVYVNAALSAD